MIALLLLIVAGYPIGRAVDREAPLLRAIAMGFLLATGLMTIVMLVVPWNAAWILIAIACISVLSGAAAPRRRTAAGAPPPHFERISPIALITLVLLIGYARYATAAPAWEVDFIADWGLKARVFFEHGGLDWSFLQNPSFRWSHQDYPPLVPFVYDFASMLGGGWDDRIPSLFFAFAAGATLLIIQSLLTDELQ